MLNLNLNTISSIDGVNPSLGANPSKITYDYSSSVWGGVGEVNQQLSITISGSEDISRNPWSRQFIASGSEAQSKTYTIQSGSNINVELTANTPFNEDDTTYVELEYIIVGGGSSGTRVVVVDSNCERGGSGGPGGKIFTGSLELAYGYSEVSISLSIPEIGYNDSTNFTSSILSPVFTDLGNQHYKVTSSINIVQFTDFYISSSIGLGAPSGNMLITPVTGSNSSIILTNLGNQSLTSSFSSTPGFIGSTVVGVAAGCNNIPQSTGGGNGFVWLNGVTYSSGGGSGRTRTGLNLFGGSAGGLNAGGGTAPNAPANFGGGGGGGSAGTATIPALPAGSGGSGVFIIRYFDPEDKYTASGGVKTKIGDFVYHQFNTAGIFNFQIPATNLYI